MLKLPRSIFQQSFIARKLARIWETWIKITCVFRGKRVLINFSRYQLYTGNINICLYTLVLTCYILVVLMTEKVIAKAEWKTSVHIFVFRRRKKNSGIVWITSTAKMSEMHTDLMSKQLERSRAKYLLRNPHLSIPSIKVARSKSHDRSKDKRASLGAQKLNIPVIKISRSRSQELNTKVMFKNST